MKYLTCIAATLLISSLGASADVTAQTYNYYDVGKSKTIELVPNLVADFVVETQNQYQAQSVITSSVQALSPGAQLTDEGSGNTRIWRTTTAIEPKMVKASSYGSTTQGSTLSPVFQEGGSLKALPGGVIVNFAKGTTPDQVKSWALSKGYNVKEKLSFGNYYLIDTPAGIDSLNLANQWHTSGEVVSATPNWWRKLSPK